MLPSAFVDVPPLAEDGASVMTGAVVGDEPPVVPPAVLPEALPDDGKDAAGGVVVMGGLVTAGAGAFVAGALAAGAAFTGTVEASGANAEPMPGFNTVWP
jgi:hypothetical protein